MQGADRIKHKTHNQTLSVAAHFQNRDVKRDPTGSLTFSTNALTPILKARSVSFPQACDLTTSIHSFIHSRVE